MEDLLLLNMAEEVGSIRAKALLERFGTVEAVFKASPAELEQVEGIGRKIAQNILAVFRNRALLDKELKLIEKYGVKIITIFDKDYPVNLKETYDPPIVLYVKGKLIEGDNQAVAIVGSRQCSIYGRNTAERLAMELSDCGITVVSGLARGIDTAAHTGALKARGATIAVLGSGLADIYPPENIKLAGQIEKSGAVISEFPMAMMPHPENFPRRNRVISGLALGTVVVEAAKNSGALITARFAAEQGREVFAVPGEAGAVKSFGTNQLIRDGAKLVESAVDVLEELSPKERNKCLRH